MNNDFATGGFEKTPLWRWMAYTIVYIGLILFLNYKLDAPQILWGGLIGGAIVTSFFYGLSKLMANPKGKELIFRNIGFLWLFYIIVSIALFIWDRAAGK